MASNLIIYFLFINGIIIQKDVVNCKQEQKHSDVEEPKILGRFQVFYGNARQRNTNLMPKMKISSKSERKFQQPKSEMEAVGMMSAGRMGPARSDKATGAYKMISESKIAGPFKKKFKGNTFSIKRSKKIEADSIKPKQKLANEAYSKKPKRVKESFSGKPKRKLASEASSGKQKRKLVKEAFNKKPKRKLTKEAFSGKPKRKFANKAFNTKPKRKLTKEAFSGQPKRKFAKKAFNTKPKRKLDKEAFSGKPKRKFTKKAFSSKPNRKLGKEFFSDKPKHKQAKNVFSMKPNKKKANEIFNKKPIQNKAKEEFIVKSKRQRSDKEAISTKPNRKLTKNYSNTKFKGKMTNGAFSKKEIRKLPKESFTRKPNRKLTKTAFSKKPKEKSIMAKRDENVVAYKMEKAGNVAKDAFVTKQETKKDKEVFDMKATKNFLIARKEREIGSFHMKPKRKVIKDAVKIKSKGSTASTRGRKITDEHQSDVISDDEKASEIRSNKEMNTLKAELKESLRVSKRLLKEVGTLKQMVDVKATSDVNDDEKEDLKALLKETVAVNKRLKKQLKRQRQIWSALQQMCKVVGGRVQEQTKNETESSKTGGTNKTAQDSFGIQPLSISTQNLPHPAVKFEFRASTPHPVIDGYAITLDGRSTYRAVVRMEYRRNNNTFVGSVDISVDHKLIYNVYLTIFHKQDYLNVQLNMKNITDIKYQTLAPVDIFIEKPNGTIVAPKEKSLNVSFFAHGNVSLISEVGASFRGLNVSANPQTIFMIYSYHDDIHITTTNMSGTKLRLSVAISEEHARFGGILLLDVMINPDHYDSSVFREIAFSRAFEILSSETQNVVPPNSIGLLPLQNTTLVSSPTHPMVCFAMGDPKPGVSLVRGTKDGLEELQPDQILPTDEFSVLKRFAINASNTNVEGKYICRATNTPGNVITSATEVLIHEPTEIRRSDAVVNGTHKMEITCVASGKPVPRVELRLYYDYGPDLAEFPSRYKIMRSSPDSRTSLLSVTISPVDTDIFRVYCHADSKHSVPQSKPIEVFPEPPEGPNFELLSELLQLTSS